LEGGGEKRGKKGIPAGPDQSLHFNCQLSPSKKIRGKKKKKSQKARKKIERKKIPLAQFSGELTPV